MSTASLVYAEGSTLTLNGGTVTGIPVTVSDVNDSAVNGKWQISSDGVQFSDATINVYTDSVTEYAIKPADSGKYLRYEQGGEYSDIIGPLPESKGPLGITTKTDDLREFSDPAYCFRLNGETEEFILLDYSESDGAFVITKGFYGRKKWAASNNKQYIKFDPKDSNNIAYALNNTFLTSGWMDDFNEQKVFSLPRAVTDYIVEHEWFTEAAHSTSNAPADYVVSAKLAFLSQTEWIKYKHIIGYGDGAPDNQWYLRTARGDNNQLAANPTGVCTQHQPAAYQGRVIQVTNMTYGTDVRPCFYLSKNFFAENVIDVAHAGENVKTFIKDNFTKDELMNGGYSLGDVAVLGFDVGEIPSVSDVVLTYSKQKGEPMMVSYSLSDMSDSEKTEVKWYSSATADGSFDLVTKNVFSDKGDKYFVKPADKNKYFKCEVIPKNADGVAGTSMMSNVVGPAIGSVGPCTVVMDGVSHLPKDTPEEYSFSIYGEEKEFVLLDAENKDEDGIFLFTKNYYGRKKWANEKSMEYVRFDPEVEGSFAYALNNEFLENGWTDDFKSTVYSFSSVMKKHIVEHKWFTESGHAKSAAAGDYNVTCKLAPLSLEEWMKYREKIGHTDDCPDNQWYLRTSRGDQETLANCILTICTELTNENKGRALQGNLDYGFDVRFGFYVVGDFFKKVKIEPTTAGSEVLKVLYQSCDLEDLKNLGYTDEEIALLGYDNIPVAKNPVFVGVLAAGEKIGVSYEYSGAVADRKAPECEWYLSDSANGEYEKVGEGSGFVLGDDTQGKYLRVVFKPVAENGLRGAAVTLDSNIPLRAPQNYSVSVDNLSIEDNTVSAEISTVNRTGDNSIKCVVSAYDVSGKLIFTECETKSLTTGKINLSKTVPEETVLVRVYCLSGDSLLKPVALAICREGE